MKYLYTITLAATLFAAQSFAENLSKVSNVAIKRIVSTVDGRQFLYIAPNIISECDKSFYGFTFGVIHIPNKEIFTHLLASKNQNVNIRFLIVEKSASSVSAAWTASTTCRIEYVDTE